MKLIKKTKVNGQGTKYEVCYLEFEDSNLRVPITALDKQGDFTNRNLLKRLATKVGNE